MTNEFSFSLKNNRNKKFLRIGWMVFMLDILLFSYFYQSDAELKSSAFFPVLGAVWLLLLVLFFKVKALRHKEGKMLSLMLLLGAIAWLVIEQPFPAALQLLMCWLGYKLPEKTTIRFTQEHVIIPALPYKKIEWSNIQHAIWKEGLLTIDFKNNTLIQEETLESPDKQLLESFHQFVRAALAKNQS